MRGEFCDEAPPANALLGSFASCALVGLWLAAADVVCVETQVGQDSRQVRDETLAPGLELHRRLGVAIKPVERPCKALDLGMLFHEGEEVVLQEEDVVWQGCQGHHSITQLKGDQMWEPHCRKLSQEIWRCVISVVALPLTPQDPIQIKSGEGRL